MQSRQLLMLSRGCCDVGRCSTSCCRSSRVSVTCTQTRTDRLSRRSTDHRRSVQNRQTDRQIDEDGPAVCEVNPSTTGFASDRQVQRRRGGSVRQMEQTRTDQLSGRSKDHRLSVQNRQRDRRGRTGFRLPMSDWEGTHDDRDGHSWTDCLSSQGP